jgi:hypothetical protein
LYLSLMLDGSQRRTMNDAGFRSGQHPVKEPTEPGRT